MMPLTLLITCLVSVMSVPADVIDPVGGSGDKGILSYRIVDAAGEIVAARLTFRNTNGSVPVLFKNRAANPDDLAIRDDVICTLSGAGSITMPVGNWWVYASRGPEWSIDKQSISIEKDQTNSVTFSLEHQVDTRGWAAADYHLHTLTHSGHGDSNMPERIISIASEALEVGVATDHNIHTDYSDIIAELDAQEHFQGIVGNEISVPLGHFNAFPLEPWGDVFDRGASDGPALFRAVRGHRDGSGIVPVVQVNHPRWDGIDYFRVAGLDPITGQSVENSWSVDFDSVEIFNENAGWGYYDADNTDKPIGSSHHWVLQDWHNLLNHGARITAVGNSDSHTVSANLAGWPRNYFPSSSDLPAEISVKEVCDTVKQGQIVTSFGPFVTFTVDDAKMGDLVTAKRAAVSLKTTVQAADWIDVDRVLVIVDGDIVETIPVPDTREVVRLIDSRKIPVRTDGWIALRVEGDDDLDPIVPGKKRPILPIAITNPVYVDADGDGKYTAPVEVARLWLEKHDGSETKLHAEWQARQPNQRAAMLLASQVDGETSRTLARWGITDPSRLVRLTACRLIGSIGCGDIEKIQQQLVSMVTSADADPWQRVVALQALPVDVAGDLLTQLLRSSGKKAFGNHASKIGSLLPGQWVMRWKASNPFPVSGESGLRKVLAMSDRERASNQTLLAAETGIVDLKKYSAERGRSENCVIALKCSLISPSKREVTIAVGSDDGCILKVGDQVLVEDFAQQGVDPMRHLVTANLKRGVNQVILLVENGGGAFGASLRVLDDAVTVQQQDAEQAKNSAPTTTQRASSDMAGIRAAADLFFLDEGRWPSSMEELTLGYLDKLPLDPWGRPYQIHSSQTRIEVVSLGADGSRGGDGINADIVSQ
ncbi:MAG: CehA/McbA family metallohydrolase [Planctomycetota bacterium]|nr:CehA/McbA family metallohydrolase [Planctomycetota bacterium]